MSELEKKKVPGIIYFGEIGNDPDEEGSLVLLAGLERLGIAQTLLVVANRNPVLDRAQVARGTLDQLGLNHVPVALGHGFGGRQTNEDIQFGAPYKSTQTNFPNVEDLFWELLEDAQDQSVLVVGASGFSDLAAILKRNVPAKDGQPKTGSDDRLSLYTRKVSCTSLMGGVVEHDGDLVTDESDYLMPTWAATNNTHDWLAAEYVYAQLQRMGCLVEVISKWAAYAANVPRDVYDRFAQTDHPVGIRLQQMQEALIQHLWHRANLPADDKEGREGLPPMLGAEWFGNVFCGGAKNVEGLTGDDRIWDKVLVFNLYDQTAVMISLNSVAAEHFNSAYHDNVYVTGINQGTHGVMNVDRTRSFLIETMLAGLAN